MPKRLESPPGWRGPRRNSLGSDPGSPKQGKALAAALKTGSGHGALTGISEDQPKPVAKKSKKLDKVEQTPFGLALIECKNTYGTMSAKTRGLKCHNGPLELRPARAARDCLSWVREDKQYSPYANIPPATSKAPKPPPTPPLWQLERSKDSKKKSEEHDEMRLGAEAGEDGADDESQTSERKDAKLEDRPPWDTEHHIMFSRMNNEVQSLCREYFDRPKVKEGDGIPKVRERYCMNDRQSNWDDTPAPLGEYRKTLYDNIGPYNRGGCKEQQLPSYWRKVKDWHSFSSPDLHPATVSGEGRPAERLLEEDCSKVMLRELADTPAKLTKDFWLGWMYDRSKGQLPPLDDRPTGWDKRWNICWSRANDGMNVRQREFFSVPEGGMGVSTSPARSRIRMSRLLKATQRVDRFTE